MTRDAPADMLDRYTLYERCAQSPADLVAVLRAIHGGAPRVLGEDFCGTAALSAEWVRTVDGGRAIAVDLDAEPLARAPRDDRIEIIRGDVLRDTTLDMTCDVLYAGNFSIGEWHTRHDLLAYLGRARRRLTGGGLFICDTYGGESAYLVGNVEREYPLPGGSTARYTWEQREADPTTGMVVNAMHFSVERQGIVECELRDAFVYRWRLWGVPELRDAMIDAGFAATTVYPKTPDAVDTDGRTYVAPISDPTDVDDSFDVLVVAHADPASLD